jgi:Mg-chelatase subunit ChlD
MKSIIALLLVMVMASMAITALAAEDDTLTNRYNVVVVVDASKSMETSDPNDFRFESISQFVNLLAEQGNYVGSVVFSTGISQQTDVAEVDSQGKKDSLISDIQSIAPGGYTNIGAALMQAINMLDEGDPALPSVILFLSDGYTDMPTEEEIEQSLVEKADALQLAREKGVSIYSVCLNAGDEVDVAEMQQLADATAGVFREVSNADDLTDVFNTFYSMIYGTASVTLVDDVFPADGVLETEFEVPGIGVEEINIVIYGNAAGETLIRPDGEQSNAAIVESSTYSLIKESEVMPGTWILRTEGVPGDRIQVNMVYNTNLSVDVSASTEETYINPADPLTISAYLRAGSVTADSPEQYAGYSADLVVSDAYQENIETYPMTVNGDHFEITHSFDEGVYYYYVRVYGNYIEKVSDTDGPLTVTTSVLTEEEKNNTAPYPVEDPVEYSVNIWPFKENVFGLDLTTLAEDAEGNEIRYKIESSSFIEGTDYTVNGDTLRMDHYSLKKGAFTVLATDSGGLSCEIEVIVKTHNIGKMTLIGLGIAILVGAAILGGLLYLALTRPFYGAITCAVGYGAGTQLRARRGRLKLAAFRLSETGIDYTTSYFQATGKNYIYLITKKPVVCGNRPTTKVQIDSGRPVQVKASGEDSRTLTVRFESLLRTKRRAGGRGSGASRDAQRSQQRAANQSRRY